MRRLKETVLLLGGIGLLGAAASGCAATAADARRDALKHQYRAVEDETVGDYARADKERREAILDYQRAAERDLAEGTRSGPLPPKPKLPPAP